MTRKKGFNNPTAHGKRGRQDSRSLFEEGGKYDLDVFHDTFLDCEDLTGYDAALKLLTGVPKSRRWREWNRIKRDWPAFNTYLQEWREELEVIFTSRALKQITAAVEEGHQQSAKWIAEQGYNRRPGAGRPSKAEKDRAAKEIAKNAAETREDKARILKIVGASDDG